VKVVIKNILLLNFVLFANYFAQTKMTLDEAIKIALEKNYDIQLAKDDLLISENNYSIGNAGFLPKVDLTASKTRTVNNTKQEYSSGSSVDKKNAGSNSTNAGIALSWTIFDGLKMFISFSKLKEYKELGEIKLRAQIENSVFDVIKNYYDIVRQKQNYKSALESVSISKERLKIAEEKFSVGSASKLDVLRAQVDLNSDKSNLLNQEVTLNSLKISLNNLLSLPVENDFDVEDSIEIKEDLSFQRIKELAFEKNTSLLQAEKLKIISAYDVNSTFAEYLPKISLGTGYNYLQSVADAGLVKSNKSYGYNYGISFSWNLFNEFNTQLAYENAKINFDKNLIYLEAIKNDVDATIVVAFKNYKKNLEILELEKTNVSVAKENLELAIEELKLGSISPIEFRDIQKNYISAQSRLITAQFIAKVSESELLKQSGILRN